MRKRLSIAIALFVVSPAQAHTYRIGDLEIVHPTIIVPQANADSSCAHVSITNHGPRTEYFLGADISIAGNTRLLHVSSSEDDITAPPAVAIAPGATLKLHRHEWCLFLSNIHEELEADTGVYQGSLMFRNAGTIQVEFMVHASYP